MKKIQIVHYTTPQKKGNFVKYNKYQVYLGNENYVCTAQLLTR